ncbi:Alanine racemase [Acidisarcina polymorpha]|uniref:Alanine racemase n=1 Tax=Acidisarcina polymorpha TaxID=2211140 RepID=A0A2Z5FYE4_9BACT|nr:alanine racemase [Acidisarcina polymorpha]AXC11425.1 Alanine racemase [Acidisarcina polymorpha]
MHTRPVWAEISRHNLIANYLELRRLAREHVSAGASVEVLAVVKADAYGHGLRVCSPLLAGAGADWLGVTSVEEGVRARAVCPESSILVMSGLWHGEADAILEHRLTPLIWERFHLDLLENATQQRSIPDGSIAVHLEIDTGMSRQGVPIPDPQGKEVGAILERLRASPALRLEGVATHFSAPEVIDGEDTKRQRSCLEMAIELIAASGLRPRWIHAGNSATLLEGEQIEPLRQLAARIGAQLMLRPGLSLYGYAPRFSGAGELEADGRMAGSGLFPVLAWKTRVTSLRTIGPGEGAGYNATFRAERATRLALLPLGYADGLSRLLSNRGSVLVHGRRAPIAGRISMDQTIVDVTDIPGVEIGDEVVVLGKQGGVAIDAYELADLMGTIPYEVLCDIAERVPRVPVD